MLKIKPVLSNNTCSNRDDNNCICYLGKSSNTAKLSCNANEQMLCCENIEETDQSKGYISTEMTLSSDLSYTNDHINKAVETSKSINTTDETVNSQNSRFIKNKIDVLKSKSDP